MFAKEFENDITPIEFMELMFNNTDENGTLYIPGWYYLDEKEHFFKCSIKWNKDDLTEVEKEFKDLLKNIKEIASIYKNTKEIEDAIAKSGLYSVWNTYVRPFDYSNLDKEELFDILDKYDTAEKVNDIVARIKNNEPISDFEKDFYEENKKVKITNKEKDLYIGYSDAFYSDCEARVGKSLCPTDLIMHARRLCKLYEVGAPEIINRNEERYLAATLVVHKYAESLEKINL